MTDYKDIENFIREEIPDCEFVGLAKEEKEVLVAFDTPYYDPQQRQEAKKMLMVEFPGMVRRVIEVAKPHPQQQQSEEQLKALDELMKEKGSKEMA